MLQKVFVSRKVEDYVAEVLMVGLTLAFLVKFFFLLLVPLGIALFAIPLALFVWLPASKAGFGFTALVVFVAALMETWTYFLFQMVYKAYYGYSFSFPLS